MDSSVPDQPSEPLAAFVSAGASPTNGELPVRSAVADIGQGPRNQIVIDDDTVSTLHARLEYNAGGWRLTDLESRNGTYVDGVRLEPGVPTPLPEGSTVGFGAARFRFAVREGVADPDSARAQLATTAEAPPPSQRSAFRLPLWLLVVILLIIAALISLIVVWGGDAVSLSATMESVSSLPLFALDPLAA